MVGDYRIVQLELFIKSPFDTSSNHLLSTLDWERLSLIFDERNKKP